MRKKSTKASLERMAHRCCSRSLMLLEHRHHRQGALFDDLAQAFAPPLFCQQWPGAPPPPSRCSTLSPDLNRIRPAELKAREIDILFHLGGP